MSSESLHNHIEWYVLNHIATAICKDSAQKTIEHFNKVHNTSLELFAPTYVVREEHDGVVRMKKVKLTFHYVFVRGTFDDLKALCCETNGFSFLINHGSEERYAIISDREMQAFRTIARAYENCLPYYSLGDIDLEDGDVVEVINGDFPGLVGTFMPRARSKSGNIVLQVFNQVGAIAYNIKVSDVRVLEFSKNSTRANDKIDAFIPHLLKALRHYHDNETLPSSLVAKLSVFCQRMEIVKLPNPKLDAKLQILLYAASHILGNTEAATTYRGRFEKLKSAITSPWTKSLIMLILCATEHNKCFTTPLSGNIVKEITSKSQQLLIKEIEQYTKPRI